MCPSTDNSVCVSVCTLGINIIHILLYLHNNKAADAGTSTAAGGGGGGDGEGGGAESCLCSGLLAASVRTLDELRDYPCHSHCHC